LKKNRFTYQKKISVLFAATLLLLALGGFSSLQAQVIDTTGVQSDSVNIPPQQRDDYPGATGTQTTPDSGFLKEGEVQFQATDSLIFNFRAGRVASLYGSAKVTHQSGQLESGKVKLNLDENLVTANTQTPQDTLSQPVLTRQGEPPVRSNKIAFNYKTEKGRFEVARVKIQDGKLTGTKVKNTSRDVVFLEDAIYSTCTLDHPHYYLKADRMKVVNQEQIFFKNARLYILDIPYPIVFPFGYLPKSLDRRQSGILQPTYVFQNTSTRGIGLRNLGWFQYFNDYLTAQASFDIFTSGTFFLDSGANYRKRGSYNGSIQIGFSRERGLESTDPNFSINTQRRIGITHNQEFSPYSSITANINFRTADFFNRNSFEINERVQTSTSSNINYRYQHPENLYNISASVRQNQNFQTNIGRLSGPSLDFSLKRFSPFSNDNTSAEDSKWYENLSVRYANSFESSFEFNPIQGDSTDIGFLEALFDPSAFREATGEFDHYQYGFRQDADISVGNLLDSQFLNLSASGNYTEFWFPTTTRRVFIPDSNRTELRQIRGFTTAREFSTSLNFSTTFYGISNAKIGNIEGFRHTVRPTISFGYRPDFSSDFFGFFREVQVDTTGRTREFSIFENQVFNGPRGGEQRAINFGIRNTFEARQVKRDSTGEKSENILRIIDQLNLNSSYNFAADSLKLSNLNTSLTSNVVSGVNLRASANFNFYERNEQGIPVNDFLLTNSGRLAELVNFSVNASTSFSGGGKRGIQIDDTPYFPARYDPYDQSIFNQIDPYFNRRPVQKLKSPWSFSLNFRYNWNLNPVGDNRKSATINAQNIQFQLTPKWNFSTQLGYDFIQKELTPSQFNLNRELHNWTLSFQFNPFGEFQYFFFRLSVNNSQIQSIFQKLPLLRNLERSSSPSGRGLDRF